MKTLVAYGTKYGYSEECAQQLAKKLKGDVSLVNLMKEKAPDLREFDSVVVGASVYMGQIQKKVKRFMALNESILQTKRLGLYMAAGTVDGIEGQFSKNFPDSLLQIAVAKESFGGVIRRERMGFFYKRIMDMVEKQEKEQGKSEMKPVPENIQKLADQLNQ